jgi:hypothetical protein
VAAIRETERRFGMVHRSERFRPCRMRKDDRSCSFGADTARRYRSVALGRGCGARLRWWNLRLNL